MTPFGTLEAGPVVHRIRLAAHGLRASILTYGAIVQDVRLDGVPAQPHGRLGTYC